MTRRRELVWWTKRDTKFPIATRNAPDGDRNQVFPLMGAKPRNNPRVDNLVHLREHHAQGHIPPVPMPSQTQTKGSKLPC